MTLKKGIERITIYFGDSRTVIAVGLCCLAYFVLYFIPEVELVARIFPPMPVQYYVILGMIVGFYQGTTWRTFQLFSGDWYKHLKTWVLLISEFSSMMFAACIVSWPIFFIYSFFVFLLGLN